MYKFTFKVKVESGGNAAKFLTLKIKVKPPFWKTWWFRMISVTAIAGALFAFLRIRINMIERQNAELERQVKERTELLDIAIEKERKARADAEACAVPA